MYLAQRARLIANKDFNLTAVEADAIVARAYGFKTYSNGDGAMGEPVPGLHIIHTPAEILAKDPAHQMIEFLRMATNLSLPGLPVVTKGIRPKHLVACMFNFTNFDALVAYAKSEPMNPHSADMDMLQLFEKRHGIKASAQILFGRSYDRSTYVIRTDADAFSHYLDQELCLTKLDGLQVALVRVDRGADKRINLYSSTHVVIAGELQENQSSLILGGRGKDSHLAISIVPDKEYTLEQVVAPHVAALSKNSPKGRSLIIDGLQISNDKASFEAGIKLAQDHQINLVIASNEPNADIWTKFESRLVFGFDTGLTITPSSELNLVLTQSSTYVGRNGQKLLFVYHTTTGGTRYTAMDLTPDAVAANIVRRVFGARRG